MNKQLTLKNLPFDTLNIDADDVQALEDIYKLLKEKFNVGLPLDIDVQLNQFEVFNNYPGASIGGTLLINHPEMGCYLLFVKVPTHIQNGRGPSINYYKYQVWAYATLRNDFGRVLIQRETLIGRILNVIHPVELKFTDDSVFNKNFHVEANDRHKALAAMTPEFRRTVQDLTLTNFIIEIVNSSLLVGSIDLITPKQTVALARSANRLSIIK